MKRLVVVGGGPAGYSAALHGALRGLSVVLVESTAVGGTCLNRGCIPLKTLLAESARGSSHPADACRRASATLVAGVEENLRRLRVQVVRGEAGMGDDGVVTVDGKPVADGGSDLVVAATGSTPTVPAPLTLMPGAIVTADAFLEEPVIPHSCLVVGGGSTGVELSRALAGLGCAVTLVEAAPRLLPAVDQELARPVAKGLGAAGVLALAGRSVVWSSVGEQGIAEVGLSDGSSFRVDLVIVAAGRGSRLEWADWEGLGVERGGDFLRTDAWCRTANPAIAAAGDIVGPWRFAHTAYQQGLKAVSGFVGDRPDLPPEADAGAPRVVYGDPEVVEVGSFPSGCRIGRFPFAVSGRAVTTGRTEGLVKAAVAPDGTIAGIGIVGSGVSELADLAGFLVQNRVPAERYLTSVHPHPTLGEAVAEAVGVALGRSIHRVRGAMR